MENALFFVSDSLSLTKSIQMGKRSSIRLRYYHLVMQPWDKSEKEEIIGLKKFVEGYH